MKTLKLVRAGKHRLLKCNRHHDWCHFHYCPDRKLSATQGRFIYYNCKEGHSFRAWDGKKKTYVAVLVGGQEYAVFKPVRPHRQRVNGEKAQPCPCIRELRRGCR